MPSSRRRSTLALVAWLAALSARMPSAEAEPRQAQGFALDRFYTSAAGGGWLVMDDLDLYGGLGGAVGLTVVYERNPLRLVDGARSLAVVSDEAFVDLGAAVSYGRFRFYLDVGMPLVVEGRSGTLGGYAFTGPSLSPSSNPDPVSDVRFGADVRILGAPRSPFRLGAGAQLVVPSGSRADYDTDQTVRGMVRVLFAGDAPYFTYAGQLGIHLRPLDDAPAPGGPRGHEMLFGLAAGAKLPLGRTTSWAAVIGPEVWGATALRSFFGSGATAVEGLLSSRFEGPVAGGMRLRVRLGAGIGSDQQFGAPSFRAACGVEISRPGREP
jgi:hypothetical protein